MKKTNKILRHLKQSAKQGNIASLFQLYENYYQGNNFFDRDKEEASKYLSQCIEKISNPHRGIILNTFKLRDFRRFSTLDIDFDKRLTVLIGDNGAGKTSIVESIAKILSWVVANIEKEGKNGKIVSDKDINVNSDHYASIDVDLSLNQDTLYTACLARTLKGMINKKSSYIKELRSLSDLYRVSNAYQEINLPLFAFYSVERSHTKLNHSYSLEKTNNIYPHSRFDAYDGALEGNGRFSDFLEWFIVLDNLANNELCPDIKSSKLSDEIKMLERIYHQFKDISIQKILKLKQKEYAELFAEFTVTINDQGKFSEQLKIIKQAIISLVANISDIYVDRSSGRAEIKVKIKNQHHSVTINQLSQGQQIIVALSADLARRLIMLNPKHSNPLEGQGIVLIDEIELHLHPRWQQNIVLGLQETFPRLQFIITTHSPQVLSTVDVSAIRQLDENPDGSITITKPTFQTKGIISSDVLEQVMGTFATPQVKEAKWLEDFHIYIEEGRQEEADAQVLFRKLKKHFGKDHPEIERCNSQIRLQKMKARARQRMKNIQKNEKS